ncbi:MAG: thiamine ABC transporter substrate-binding protein [Actinobacteria bacterium]|nr:thiamine ABC transporter substrate-binding protein [Actinomycetota bacterium]
MRRLVVPFVVLLTAAGALTTACGGDSAPAGTVRLLTHDSFFISDDARAAFTAATGLRLEVRRAGDAGSMVNQAVLTAGNPVADVLYGVDTTFLSRSLDADLFLPYQSPLLAGLYPGLAADPQHRVTPVDFGDVCLNYDKAAFATIPPPQTLADLADPAYRGLLVVQDPSTSSPGLAFLLATIATFGEEGPYTWKNYWADLRANDVRVAAGWEEAYYGAFSGGAGEGDRPIVVSYASSPPAEVIYADPPVGEAPTAVVTDGCFRQVEFAGILRGTRNESAARALLDFLLSERFQEEVPLTMFVFPALASVELPPEFVAHTRVPTAPLTMDPARIEANRDRWIAEWASIVLR